MSAEGSPVSNGTDAPRASTISSSVSRALRVLEHVLASPDPLPPAALAKSLQIPRSTLSALLMELRGLGYISVSERGYVSGSRLISLAYLGPHRLSPPDGMQEMLERIASETGETATYSIHVGGSESTPGDMLPIAQVESPQGLRYVARLGKPYPLLTTAAGVAMLSALEWGHDQVQLLLESAAEVPNRELPSLADLIDEIETVQNQGYAVHEYHEVSGAASAIAVATVLRDASGTPLGALAVTGPAERMREATERVRASLLGATAHLAG
jgi:IclR family transcriptional regulator, acetate operon repressor